MARKIHTAWLHLRIDGRAAWIALMELVDSRTVRLFQIIVYASCALAGIYAALFAEPVSVVDVALGNITYAVWVWMNVLCPLLVAVGCWLGRDRGDHLSRSTTNGMLLQLAGDVGMVFTFGAYVAALLAAAWWGKGTYAVWIISGLTLCALLLVFGDARRLWVNSERTPR